MRMYLAIGTNDKALSFSRLFLGLILYSIIGCKESSQLYRLKGTALGTTYSILLEAPPQVPKSGNAAGLYSQNSIEMALDSLFEAVNQSMSTYRPSSRLSRSNQGDSTVVMDQMFSEVFVCSKQVFEATAGAFDPTVGQLVNAWGFGPEEPQMKIDSSGIAKLVHYVGMEKVQLLPDGRLKKRFPEVYLEFNAIAKGYCIDRIAVLLDAFNCKNYLIELGGELVAQGIHPVKRTAWVVGIDDPNQTLGDRKLSTALRLKDRAMATSGNYRKYRIDSETGQKYVHTIDPHTGFPKKTAVLSVSVLAPTCALADAYATAFMAMELDSIRALLREDPILEAYVIYDEGQGTACFVTSGFKEELLDSY